MKYTITINGDNLNALHIEDVNGIYAATVYADEVYPDTGLYLCIYEGDTVEDHSAADAWREDGVWEFGHDYRYE